MDTRQLIKFMAISDKNSKLFKNDLSVAIFACCDTTYRKTSSISRTLVGNKIIDNSDVVGASPVGAAPTTSSFST